MGKVPVSATESPREVWLKRLKARSKHYKGKEFYSPYTSLRTILMEENKLMRDIDAQLNIIDMARTLSSAIRTTLGPKGMDKMVVDVLGVRGDESGIVITNDGLKILEKMEIVHPAAKAMAKSARTVDEEVGDGTTTSVVIAGELLRKAGELMEMGIHPSVVSTGFRIAYKKAREVLDEIAMDVDIRDRKLLKRVARTAMTGREIEAHQDHLSEIVVDACSAIAEETDGRMRVDLDNLHIEKREGGEIGDTMLVRGILVDREVLHPSMPRRVENAKIALIDSRMGIKKAQIDEEVKITSLEQFRDLHTSEDRMMRSIVDRIKRSGANVVICKDLIMKKVPYYLAKEGILAVRRVKAAKDVDKSSDMERIAKATGGKIVTDIKDLSEDDLGEAGLVEERGFVYHRPNVDEKIDRVIFIEKCKNPRAFTILLRGGTKHVIQEAERGLIDALRAVSNVIEDGRAVAGGGAPEIELSLKIRKFSTSLSGKEQLAVEKFAEAMEIIPRTLAENSGFDPIDKVVELKAEHMKGAKNAGLDVYTGKIADMWDRGIIEPLKMKKQVIASAVESTIMILRIEDIIMRKVDIPYEYRGAPSI